jgi:cytochrome c oxidase subunit 4
MSTRARSYVLVWYGLIILVIVSVAAAALLPKTQALVLVFTVAVAKALLVARYYMHLKREKALIYALALVPLLFLLVFLFGLFPDFVYPTGKH